MTAVIDFKGGSGIEAEARAWIVQLDGRTPTGADLASLREWANRSPRHAAALREMASLWGNLDALALARDAIETAARLRQRRSIWRGAAVAAGAVAALVIAAFVGFNMRGFLNSTLSSREVHATAVGQQQRVELPDGSSVQLNTNSVVVVTFSPRERGVRLIRGEAFFDVAHDTRRPFVVFADSGAVRAVGTTFAVRLETERVEVTVAEGAVELFSDAGAMDETKESPHALLAALQTASMSPEGSSIRSVPPQELDRMLAWRTGVLVFEGEPLGQVIDEIGRYMDADIVVADEELLDLRIGGRFGIGETDALLEVLESGFDVHVSRDGDGAVVLSQNTTQQP